MKAFDWQRMALDKVPVESGGGGVAQPLYLRSGLYFPQDYRTARRAADVAVRGADYFDPRLGGG